MNWIIFIYLVLVIFLNYRETKQAKTFDSQSDRYYIYASQIAIFVGVAFRLLCLNYPNGINVDEAIAGYDAWCITNYGVDQHLNSYPMYLKSWGSGQSALYAYLSAPFVYFSGLSLPMHRLPMALVSSTSIIILYFTIKKVEPNKLFLLLATLFFVFNPWHIAKSRWALDCNLAPDLALIATCFVALAYYAKSSIKQTILYTSASLFFVLTAYAYGVAWFMLPIYCLLILVYLLKKRKLNIKISIISLGIALVVSIPLILFAYTLLTGGEAMHIGSITIPKLTQGRQDATHIYAKSFHDFLWYILLTIKSLTLGYDHLMYNSYYFSGQFYNPIGWFFILIAARHLYHTRKLNVLDSLFLFWIIACIPFTLYIEYNVNRWNMLWPPLIYLCIKGIYVCIVKKSLYQNIFYVLFAVCSIYFAITYITLQQKSFSMDIDVVTSITSSPRIEKVYITHWIEYPVVMFYDPLSPYTLNATLEEQTKDAAIRQLSKWGKYNTGLPYLISPIPKTAYVFSSWNIHAFDIDYSKFKIKKGDSYTIIWNE